MHYIVDTKFGRLALTPTSADHIYATTNPGGGRVDQLLPWTIRGKEHKFITAHLYRWSDGKFHVGDEKDTLSLHNGLYANTLSTAARKLAVPVLESAVNKFINDNASIVRAAAIEDADTRLARLEAERTELQTKLWNIEAKISAAVIERARIVADK